MIKKYIFKNYQFLLFILIFVLILLVTINPKIYMDSTFNGFCIWAKIVLPSLFCFFILTKLLMQNIFTQKIFSLLDKPFKLIYDAPPNTSYIFFMSIISGYPLGAKLISEFYISKKITKENALLLSSFCSTTGPMFIIGSVAIGMFNNTFIGIIVFISHITSALLNGLIYKIILSKSRVFFNNINEKALNNDIIIENKKIVNNSITDKKTLNDIMYDTILSVTMIGGFIALSFTLLELFSNIKLFSFFSYLINFIVPNSVDISNSVFSGIIEMTNGCLQISQLTSTNTYLICSLLSFVVSFGGLSIHLQSNIFLSKCDVKYKFFLATKITHGILSVLICLLICHILV